MSQPTARSVTTVVLGAGGQDVLLHLRGDVYLWSLPGGGVEPGEAWELAAIREAQEETGFDIAIDRLAGEYHRPGIGDVKRLFVGHVIAGEATVRPPESIRIAWFPASRLPFNRMPWTRDYVRDALTAPEALTETTQRQPWHVNVAMRLLYALADFRVSLGRGRDRLVDRTSTRDRQR